jgi:Flp pilus assembly protein TadG
MKSGWKDERGQALLMTALSLGMIFGILGLTVDVGWAYYRQQAAQTAAEAAALAAVKSAQTLSSTFTCGTDLECPSTATACPSAPISSTLSPSYNSVQIGCYYAYLDGFSAGGSSGAQSVTMAAGTGTPTTVPNVSTAYWVTARVSESISQLFSGINSGNNSLTASARATAAIINQGITACAYLLSPTGTGLSMTGSGSFTSSGCSINVNSDGASAVSLTGSGSIKVGYLNVVGPASCAGAQTCGISQTGSGGFGTTKITTGITSFSDPLAALPEPTLGTCKAAVNSTGSSPVSLTAGTYCGGISVTGSGNVTLASGTYIIDGGGLTLTGSGNVTGTDVMIYNTFDSTHAFAPVDITGSGNINLTAPTSGPYQGVLFFEDRNAPSGETDKVTGSGNLNVVGDLYFKNSTLDVTGSGSSTDVAIIANKLSITGSGNFAETVLSTASAPSVPMIALIE